MKHWLEYSYSDLAPEEVTQNPGEQVAEISYSKKLGALMGLFKVLHSRNEYSERALAVTSELVVVNPAYYFVWDFRFEILKHIGNEIFDYKQVGFTPNAKSGPLVGEDGSFINEFTLKNPKNYQIWNYRALLLDPENSLWYRGEKLIVSMILEKDPKNFHAWSHLRWVLAESRKHEDDSFVWSDVIKESARIIRKDPFNNSAWTYRFFLFKLCPELVDGEYEINFISEMTDLASDSEATWVYMFGFLDLVKENSHVIQKAVTLALDHGEVPIVRELMAEHADSFDAESLIKEIMISQPQSEAFWLSQLQELRLSN